MDFESLEGQATDAVARPGAIRTPAVTPVAFSGPNSSPVVRIETPSDANPQHQQGAGKSALRLAKVDQTALLHERLERSIMHLHRQLGELESKPSARALEQARRSVRELNVALKANRGQLSPRILREAEAVVDRFRKIIASKSFSATAASRAGHPAADSSIHIDLVNPAAAESWGFRQHRDPERISLLNPLEHPSPQKRSRQNQNQNQNQNYGYGSYGVTDVESGRLTTVEAPARYATRRELESQEEDALLVKQAEISLTELNAMFSDFDAMLREQQRPFDLIEENVAKSSKKVQLGAVQLSSASASQRTARRRMCLVIFLVLAIIVVGVLFLTKTF